MSCYRLTFKNSRVFEVQLGAVEVTDELSRRLCTAVIYRVTKGAREDVPLQRADGTPIQIAALSPSAALDIVTHVLRDVTGSDLDRLGGCGASPDE